MTLLMCSQVHNNTHILSNRYNIDCSLKKRVSLAKYPILKDETAVVVVIVTDLIHDGIEKNVSSQNDSTTSTSLSDDIHRRN